MEMLSAETILDLDVTKNQNMMKEDCSLSAESWTLKLSQQKT